MKSSSIVGRRIVRVTQQVRATRVGGEERRNIVHYIELEGGIRLIPVYVETDWDSRATIQAFSKRGKRL